MQLAMDLFWGAEPQTQKWRTPDALWVALHAKYAFTLDAYADDSNYKLRRYNTSLRPYRYPWKGESVFANPPFSIMGEAVDRACEDCPSIAVLLGPANVETRWFHRAMNWGATCWVPDSRVKYTPPPGVKKSTPAQASIILEFDPHNRVPWTFKPFPLRHVMSVQGGIRSEL